MRTPAIGRPRAAAPGFQGQQSQDSLLARLLFAWRIYRERRALLALSDRTLKDIGLSRSQVYREASRGLLDLPDQHPDDRRKPSDW